MFVNKENYPCLLPLRLFIVFCHLFEVLCLYFLFCVFKLQLKVSIFIHESIE